MGIKIINKNKYGLINGDSKALETSDFARKYCPIATISVLKIKVTIR